MPNINRYIMFNSEHTSLIVLLLQPMTREVPFREELCIQNEFDCMKSFIEETPPRFKAF